MISARDPGGKRLFADYRELEAAYFRKTRIFPIMHVVVLRRDVYERDRWIAMNLLQGVRGSEARAAWRALAEIGASQVPMAWIADHARQWQAIAGEDFWPYGIEPNRPTLEAFLQYGFEQGVCASAASRWKSCSRRRRCEKASRSSPAFMPMSLTTLAYLS